MRAARSGAEWPVLGESFVRPDAIMLVGYVEGASPKWMGSEIRSRWAGEKNVGGPGAAEPPGES